MFAFGSLYFILFLTSILIENWARTLELFNFDVFHSQYANDFGVTNIISSSIIKGKGQSFSFWCLPAMLDDGSQYSAPVRAFIIHIVGEGCHRHEERFLKCKIYLLPPPPKPWKQWFFPYAQQISWDSRKTLGSKELV